MSAQLLRMRYLGHELRGPRHRVLAWKELELALQAGLPLPTALEKIQSKDLFLKLSLSALQRRLQEGIPLLEAVKQAKYLFPRRFHPYLEQGEKSHSMPAMFGLMHKQYRDYLVWKGNITGMALYPCIVWSIAIICFRTMKIYVEPVFVKMFQDSGIVLPATWPIFEIAVLISAGLFLVWRLYPLLVQGDYLRRLYEALPYFGRAFHYRFWTEFSRVLGQLLAQGVAVPEAIEAAGGVMAGRTIQEAARRAGGKTREGIKLSEALREGGQFPASLVWTVAQGELTGNLPKALQLLAERYERARDHYSENSYQVMEVIFTILMASGIGSMVLRYYHILFSITLPFN